jgi:hypothetical protein
MRSYLLLLSDRFTLLNAEMNDKQITECIYIYKEAEAPTSERLEVKNKL